MLEFVYKELGDIDWRHDNHMRKMEHKHRADIRFQLLLPANLRFPEQRRPRRKITLFRRSDLVVTLHRSDILEDLRKDRQILQHLNRVLITPTVQIEMMDRSLLSSELPQNGRQIMIKRTELQGSAWFIAANEVVSIFNTLLYKLYRVFHKDNFLSMLIAPSTLNYSGGVFFPNCLNLWSTSVRINKGQWLSDLSFEMDSPYPYISKVVAVEFEDDSLTVFRNLLKSVDPVVPKWPLAWQYLFLAVRHYQENNLRLAIIDLDIAGDIIVREWMRKRTKITGELFERMSQKLSTGEFISSAIYLCNDDPESNSLIALQELHNLRNTILHRHQLSLRRNHQQIFDKAKSAAILLLKQMD